MPFIHAKSPHAEYELPDSQDVRIKIGSRISAARKKLGMSQTEVANTLGKKSPAYLSLVENGSRNIMAADLVRLAVHFKMPLSHFYP